MTINADVQTLEPGAQVVFWHLDASMLNAGEVRFHANRDGPMWWRGQEYSPWAITAEGFARTSDQQPRPKLAVQNVGGSISLLCHVYDDLIGAVLTRYRTLERYIDAANFPNGTNPTADPNEQFTPERWIIDRKSSESPEVVEFELSSALDFMGVQLPRRQIIANQCPWAYRGAGCAYVGPPVADKYDVPTSDPTKDACSHTVRGCKLRQWPDGVLNYGGFVAAGLVRT